MENLSFIFVLVYVLVYVNTRLHVRSTEILLSCMQSVRWVQHGGKHMHSTPWYFSPKEVA
jgi:hypothetical protein